MIGRIVLHPLLFAIFPALFLYVHNLGDLSLGVVVAPLACIVVCTALAYLVAWLFTRDARKAGIIVSFFSILFFSYGAAYRALAAAGLEVTLCGVFIGPDVLLWPCGLLAMVCVAYY